MSEVGFLSFLENLEISATCEACGRVSFEVFSGQACPHHRSIAYGLQGDEGSIQHFFTDANEED